MQATPSLDTLVPNTAVPNNPGPNNPGPNKRQRPVVVRFLAAGLAAATWLLPMLGACTDDSVVEQAECLSATTCGNICVDTNVDPDHCGKCFRACDVGLVCSFGGCRSECGGGTSECTGGCYDLQSDPQNCGECGVACDADKTCAGGACVTTCAPNTTQCGEVCANTAIDTANCGGCGIVCGPGALCSDGNCELACGGTNVDCGGSCVNTTIDALHCGGCDSPCPTDELCIDGTCDLVCLGGSSQCGGSCVNTMADGAHCGGCDSPCVVGEVCNMGFCDLSCGGGTTECGTSCIDTDINPLHCGACDSPCNTGEQCIAGNCITIVDCNGATNCAGECINTQIDSNHCGLCGNPCGDAAYCSGGVCVPTFGGCTIVGDNFANGLAGWTMDAEWAIGPAVASSGTACGGSDPAYDHTPTGDNGIAGVVLGGDAMQSNHGYYYLTSPATDTTFEPTVLFRYWRWLVSDVSPNMDNIVEVYDGSAWQTIYQGGVVADSAWTQQTFDVTAHQNSAMQIRFGFQVGNAGVLACPSWNIDDMELLTTNCN